MRDLISRYFGLDAQRDTEGIVALFADDAIVVDEGKTYRGTTEIRAWQLGPASKYVYTTEVLNVEGSEPDRYLATGRLTGNFPGGTVDLRWDFTLADDQIKRLVIAP
jgi:ketosteroid isomerase-like protein